MHSYPLPFGDSAPGMWTEPTWPLAGYEVALSQAKAIVAHLPVAARSLFRSAVDATHNRIANLKPRASDYHLVGHMVNVDHESTVAFRDYCYLMTGECGQDTQFKVRTEYRAWSAGMYIRGAGSLVVRCFGDTNCRVEYFPWEDNFFLQSYRDTRRSAQLSQTVWGNAYCADKLADSGAGVASVKPFMFDDRTWIITSICSGGSEPAMGEAWSLRPITEWPGVTYSYATQGASVEKGLIERGDHRGLVVRARGALHVIDGAMTVFEKAKPVAPRRMRAPDIPAQTESLDIDGNALFAGARCTIATVHHPAFNKELGKAVVVSKLAGEQVWASDDKPVQYRINRNKRRVIDHDPSCVQTIYAAASLRLRS
jgi:hypothetical protein